MNENTVKTYEVYSKDFSQIIQCKYPIDAILEFQNQNPLVDIIGLEDVSNRISAQFTPQSAPVSETTGQVEGKHRQGEVYPNDTDFDKMSKHYNNNVFMRNADIWTDEHDWVMSKDRFISVIEKLFSLPAHKVDAYVADLKKYFNNQNSTWNQMAVIERVIELLSIQPVSTPAPQEVPPAPANEGVDVKNISQQGEQC